jgi:hypothetical protein
MSHHKTRRPIPSATWHCGDCEQSAVLLDQDARADLACYICPHEHVTLVDLTRLKQKS